MFSQFQLQNVSDIMKTNASILQRFPESLHSSAIVGKGPSSGITPAFRKQLQLYADETHPKAKCFVIKIKDPLDKWFTSKLNTVLGEDVMRKLAAKLELSQDDLLILAYGPEEETVSY